MNRLITITLSILIAISAFAQQFTATGVVTSKTDGEPLIGVGVQVKGTTRGTVTDIDGNYKINVSAGEVLIFSYVGYIRQEIKVTSESPLNVKMEEDSSQLDEVVVVGYGTVKKITMTGAASNLDAEAIRRVPTSSVQNALSGKLPGFFSQQRSGQPGKDASDFFIRGVSSLNGDGNKPLIIVDDVEYSYDQLSQINVNEIESITILKDASTTAIYGIKGANGVLVVKTRRGVEGAPRVTVRLEGGVQMPVRTPRFLNSYNTAILVNEAYANDHIAPQWSEEDINLFRTGADPYGHPDVNWYDEVFKSSAWQENANIDISGGSKRLTYFISMGYLNQDGLVKNFSSGEDKVNSSYFYHRFNFRTNLDFKVVDNLSMRLDVTSRFMNINEPRGINATGEIYDWSKMHPYSAPVVNPNGSTPFLYDTDGKKAILPARLANEGYTRNRRNDNNILFGVDWGLDWLTPGLSAQGRIAYASIDENYRQARREKFPTYHYDSQTDTYTINPDEVYTNGTYDITGWNGNDHKNFNLQLFLKYNRTFNDLHDVNAMLLYNRQSDTNVSGAGVPANFEGYTLSLGYRYKSRYLFDFNAAYNGTDRFGSNNRFGFFPSVSLGYILSEEDFFLNSSVSEWWNLLKFRGSFGIVGSDVAPGNRYLYKQFYYQYSQLNQNFNYFGERIGGTNPPNYYEGDLGTDNITWEKSRKWDVGLELRFLNRINLNVDWFYDIRYDQLVSRSSAPLILGVGLAPSNVARTRNTGFDGSISYNERLGRDFELSTSLVFSYAKNKVLYKDEAQKSYPWLMETGHPINQPFGYKWIGYYTPDDIAAINAGDPNAPAIPNTSTTVQAGDLMYKDLNGDGVIDDYDKCAIGKPNLPTTTLGWSIGGSWKGFSLNVLFQGSFDYSFALNGTAIEPFKSQFQPIHTYRWTEERWANGEEILFPRLTSNPSTINSAQGYMSDFWLVDAWYVRLKTIDLSYQFSKKILPKAIQDLRLYVNAYNLFTWTNYNKYQQDPEISTNSAGDTYMNQRVVNMGVQITF
ncbi:MAG: TonB-dependent receptor [Bacteroides sp.]|nr:TonB-dependent receptor [Bacteroides sp.]